MSQPIHHQTFFHYTPPGVQQQQQQQQLPITHVAPKDVHSQAQLQQLQQQQYHQSMMTSSQPVASTSTTPAQPSSGGAPVIAKGDWTKDLVHLAKTAELKKHALTLQLHTAHILSAHANLEQKSKAIQDLLEQRNKLESERTRLLNCLRQINEDRDKVDLMEAQLKKECADTQAKIEQLTNGDYAVAKGDVDRLRAELGQPPMPSLQETLDERRSQYLTERRLNGNAPPQSPVSGPISASASASTAATAAVATVATTSSSASPNAPPPTTPSALLGTGKRPPSSSNIAQDVQAKRPRGRPKGSKNRSTAKASGGGDAGNNSA